MGDHSTEIVLFFFGSALLLGIEAMKMAGWRAYVLWALAGLSVACGAFWSLIKEWSPPVTAFVTSIATSPQTWFTLAVLLILLLIVSGRQKLPSAAQDKAGADFLPRAEGLDSAQVQAFKNTIEHTNKRFDGWKDELCNRIQQGIDYRDKQDKAIFEAIEKIKSQIAIDLPNASTLADAFRNLDQAVHAQMQRISEQIQGYSDRLNRDNLSLQHLLYFAMQLSAENMLVYLLSRAPVIGDHERLDLVEPAFQKNSDFLEEVSRGLSGTQRFSDFRQILYDGEVESDRRLKELPVPEWTTEGLNPIVLRRYFIAGLTRRRVAYYLEQQLVELREKIRNTRNTMQEQYDQRQKKPN